MTTSCELEKSDEVSAVGSKSCGSAAEFVMTVETFAHAPTNWSTTLAQTLVVTTMLVGVVGHAAADALAGLAAGVELQPDKTKAAAAVSARRNP
mgnify:FL=1